MILENNLNKKFITDLLYRLVPLLIIAVALYIFKDAVKLSSHSVFLGMAFIIGISTASLGSYYRCIRNDVEVDTEKRKKELYKDITFIIVFQIIITFVIDILFF